MVKLRKIAKSIAAGTPRCKRPGRGPREAVWGLRRGAPSPKVAGRAGARVACEQLSVRKFRRHLLLDARRGRPKDFCVCGSSPSNAGSKKPVTSLLAAHPHKSPTNEPRAASAFHRPLDTRARAIQARTAQIDPDLAVILAKRSRRPKHAARRSKTIQTPQTQHQPCVRSSTSRAASAATRSAPSSGRSSPTSTASTPRAPTTATRTSSSSASTCTTMRPRAAATSPAPSSWTSSPAPWTPCARAPSASSSARTTSCSARRARATTGPRATTRRAHPRVRGPGGRGRGAPSGAGNGYRSK